MRPVAMRIQAFGSFAEVEHVRFDTLAELGLFVVSGPTGSGKSTVFDAMSVALFGRVPGDRPPDVRSHHAQRGLDTEVELEFEVESRRWKVWRKPAQERERLRGTGVRQLPAEAELYEWVDGAWQGVVSQHTRVTERCIEIVGLDLEQFQRVVLLPQGKFAEFLLSDTAKRQELLRQLFGSALYLRATEWYQEHARRLHADVAEIEQIIEHHRTNARDDVREVQQQIPPETDGTLFSLGPDELPDDVAVEAIDAALQACLPQLGRRVDEHRVLVEAAGRAAREAALARDGARRYDRAAERRRERAALTERADEIAAAAERIGRARTVVPVQLAHARCASAHRVAASARDSEAAARLTVHEGFSALGLAAPERPDDAHIALARRSAELAAQLERFDAVSRARRRVVECGGRLDRARAELSRAEAASTSADAAHAAACDAHDAVAERAAQLEVANADERAARERVERRARLEQLGAEVLETSRTLEVAVTDERRLLELFALGVAPRLAATLTPGEPCVVCGSIEHPLPAQLRPGVAPVETVQLGVARDAVDAARHRLASAVAEVDLLRRDLGELAAAPLADLEQGWEHCREIARAARSARSQLGRSAERVAELERLAASAAQDLQRASTELAAAQALDGAAEAELAAQLELVHGMDEEQVRRASDVARSLGRAWPRWAAATADLGRASSEVDAADADLRERVVASGHQDLSAALGAALDDDQIVELETLVDGWHKQLAEIDLRLRELDEQGVPQRRPDVDELVEAARRAEIDATSLGTVITRIEQRCHDAATSIERARSTIAASAELRAEHEVAREVMLTTSGQLGQRIMFETWVLAAELDRVTDAASVHLHRMSAGRYALRRGDTGTGGNRRTGLDLLVFDAHTGRERVPATLSGGERFQASLALALGLADVVSQGGTGSGRVFEALFVDEGFGSLDPDALDDAIEALQHLQAGGRMVGVITHVEAMKHQLRTGIEVRMRPDGRGATIVQAEHLASAP